MTREPTTEGLDLLRNCLATAEIMYHLPDYPDLLQSYIWQNTDLAPELPKLKHFLDFWSARLDGKLHSVSVSMRSLVDRKDIRVADGAYLLH